MFDYAQEKVSSEQAPTIGENISPYLHGRDAKKEKYSLAFEAIKIVELMSQLNIEEFQMN